MKKNKSLSVLFIAVTVFLVTGCAGGLKPNPNNHIRTIAVLPMVNNTNDVQGPKIVRDAFTKELLKAYYIVKPNAEVDQTLKNRMGITLGRQLGLTTAQKLGKQLGVDGVFYGYLINFDDKVSGAYNVKQVRMGWKLVDVKTGKILWGKGAGARKETTSGTLGAVVSVGATLKAIQGEKMGPFPASKNPNEEMPGIGSWDSIERKSGDENLGSSLLRGLGEKVVAKAIGIHLKAETNLAMRHLIYAAPQILTGPVEAQK